MGCQIRKDNDKIDEVIANDVNIHLEYMDDGRIWIGIDHKDGTTDHIGLFTKRGGEILSIFESMSEGAPRLTRPLPNDLPPDLRIRLETVLGFKSYGPADLYGAFKEWADECGVTFDGPLIGDEEISPILDQ